MKRKGIGLLGFGTVGAGVAAGLQKNGAILAARQGIGLRLAGVADLDLKSDRGVKINRDLLTTDARAVIDDAKTDIIVELIGGTGAAADLVRRALELGKPVVTANKALLAERGRELFDLAAKNGTAIYFGASVGGGIPIIRALRRGMIANRVESICGILNGTCNYILTRMERDRLDFDTALAEAQQRGYAEAAPSLDIDGTDTAHKAAILASLACGSAVPFGDVHVEGIRGMSAADLRYAEDLGYRIKLLAVIKRSQTRVETRVHPTLIPLGHVLASVSGVYNAVLLRCDLAGTTLYYGRGAGREPTASTVLGDIADAARDLVAGNPPPPPVCGGKTELRARNIGEVETRYYLRLSLADRPGVLAEIASILGEHGISIASVLQKEGGEIFAPVVIVTHCAVGARMEAALKRIDRLKAVGARTVRIRIEDFKE